MSNNLNIAQVAGNQDQKEVTINQATGQIDAALTEHLTVDLTSANASLTDSQFRGAMKFDCSGHTVPRNMTVPQLERAFFVVENLGTGALSVVRGTTSISVPIGGYAAFATDGAANGLKQIFGRGEDPFDLGFFFGGIPADNVLAVKFVVVRAFNLPLDLTGSQAKAGTASTGTAEFEIQKNGSAIGTVSFATSTTGAFVFSSATSFAAGDTLEIITPTPPDDTLADIAITLKGTK
jgi:hypothetical protein